MLETRSGNEGIPYSIREDFDVDRDIRVIPYDKYLLSVGFKYISTKMGPYGGSREYSHPSSIHVFVGRWNTDILWSIDNMKDRELGNGSGLQALISKLGKFVDLKGIKNYSRFSTMKKAFGIIIPKKLNEI